MKVHELIKHLEAQDPNGEVVFIAQRGFADEVEIADVISRADVKTEDGPDETAARKPGARDDVFLVEGKHLREGSYDVWDAIEPRR